MKHYETLMLLPVSATPNDFALIEKQLRTLVKAANGSVAAFDKWGRYRLAYPINKQEYGCYVLARYEVAEVQVFFQKLESFLKIKCVDTVVRYVHVNLTAAQYAEPYIKPEAMEGAQNREGREGGQYRPRTGFAPSAGESAAVEAVVVEGGEEVVATAVEAVEATESVIEG